MKKGPRFSRGPGCKSKTFWQRHPYPSRPKIASPNRLIGVRSLCPPGNQLGRQRGLRGCHSGQSGPGRTLSSEERQAVEDRHNYPSAELVLLFISGFADRLRIDGRGTKATIR
jgi:hypothetical protein